MHLTPGSHVQGLTQERMRNWGALGGGKFPRIHWLLMTYLMTCGSCLEDFLSHHLGWTRDKMGHIFKRAQRMGAWPNERKQIKLFFFFFSPPPSKLRNEEFNPQKEEQFLWPWPWNYFDGWLKVALFSELESSYFEYLKMRGKPMGYFLFPHTFKNSTLEPQTDAKRFWQRQNDFGTFVQRKSFAQKNWNTDIM